MTNYPGHTPIGYIVHYTYDIEIIFPTSSTPKSRDSFIKPCHGCKLHDTYYHYGDTRPNCVVSVPINHSFLVKIKNTPHPFKSRTIIKKLLRPHITNRTLAYNDFWLVIINFLSLIIITLHLLLRLPFQLHHQLLQSIMFTSNIFLFCGFIS